MLKLQTLLGSQWRNLGLPAPLNHLEGASGYQGLSVIRLGEHYWICHEPDLKLAIQLFESCADLDETVSSFLSGLPAWCITNAGGLKEAVSQSRRLLDLKACRDTLSDLRLQIING